MNKSFFRHAKLYEFKGTVSFSEINETALVLTIPHEIESQETKRILFNKCSGRTKSNRIDDPKLS